MRIRHAWLWFRFTVAGDYNPISREQARHLVADAVPLLALHSIPNPAPYDF